MIVKSISLDEETELIIQEKRKQDGSFNLSEFIRASLNKNNPSSNTIPLETIEKNLKEADLKIDMAKNNKEHWEKCHQNFLVNIELKKQEQERLKELELTKENKKKERENNIRSTFNGEMKREMTDFEFSQYEKDGRNIWAFCEMLKEKEE